eukprot:8207322-Pyramimonas_sp.AAC.2
MTEVEGFAKKAPPFRPGSDNTFSLPGGAAGHGDHYTRMVDEEQRLARATAPRRSGPIEVQRTPPPP